MNPPQISICMPAYRADRYLQPALDSVRRQTFTDWELILVEDGSHDRAEELVNVFARQGTQPVQFVRHAQNQGLPATRNTGIAMARGAWIALLDSDDLWEPQHLASLLACAQARPDAGLVHSGSVLFDSDTGRELETRAPSPDTVAGFPLSLFLGNYIIQPSSVLMQKALWSRVQGFDPSFRYVEDREMWMRCARSGAVFAYTGRNTCLYRKHGTALTTHAGPMAVAAARVFDKAADWPTIPKSLRRRHAAAAWRSAGRISLRADPRAARGFFQCALRHRPFSALTLLYWTAASLLALGRREERSDRKSAEPAAPSVSVVMATFNGARFIREQLESLRQQTLRPAELIVCDDISTDETCEIVEDFGRSAPFPVVLHRNPVRLGYGDNFISGMERATGNLIAFCDQDDVWHPTKLQRCAEALSDPRVLLAVHSSDVVGEDMTPQGHRKPDFSGDRILEPQGCELDLSLPGFAMVFRTHLTRGLDKKLRARDCMKEVRPAMPHDQWVYFLARSAGAVAILPESLSVYRQHMDNTCGAVPPAGRPALTLRRACNQKAYRKRAEAAAHCAQYLSSLASTINDQRGSQWRRSAAQYQWLSACYSQRSALYDPTGGSWRRIRTFAALAARGAYRSHEASGLGWRALLKDAGSLLMLK